MTSTTVPSPTVTMPTGVTNSTKDPRALFVKPEWADLNDSDVDDGIDQFGDMSAIWVLAHQSGTDPKLEVAVARRDYYFASEGFSSHGPHIEATIGDADPSEPLTSKQARELAWALLAAADDLDRINVVESGRRTWDIQDLYAAYVKQIWIIEVTLPDGTVEISSGGTYKPDDGRAIGDEWDSNRWPLKKKDYSANPERYRRIAVAEIITEYRDDRGLRMALVAEIPIGK